jgi:hypothetical protein
MTAPEERMNRFERILFRLALVLGGLVVALRLGSILVMWYLHHVR